MKTIQIDSEIYTYLLKNALDFGETPSDILRRLLGIASSTTPIVKPVPEGVDPSGLGAHLASMEFRYSKGVVGKFLSILGWIYKNHQSEFSRIENIKGRGRIYFSQDIDTLNQSGKSVNPKQIPGSPYWVITTTPSILKKEILENVMNSFGYSEDDIYRAKSAIIG